MKPLSNQEIIDLLETEMRNDLDAYTQPGNVVYSVTQDEILAFARKMGVTTPEAGPGAVLTPIESEIKRHTEELIWLEADLSTIEQMLANMNEDDDVIAHMQFSQRQDQRKNEIMAKKKQIDALSVEAKQE
jgi:hypothetical protein